MLKSGDYADKVIMRVIEADGENIRDFNGSLITSEKLGNRYSLELTPTVVFLDAQGNLLTEVIGGMSSVDLYGGLLDEAIISSLASIQQRGDR